MSLGFRLANNLNVNAARIITRIDVAQKYILLTSVFLFGIVLSEKRNNEPKTTCPIVIFDVVSRNG